MHVVAAGDAGSGPSDILAGTTTIGSGIAVFGEFCAPSAVTVPIVDLGDLTDTTNISGKRTSPMVHVAQAGQGVATRVQGSTLAEYSTQFSGSVGMQGQYGYFAGEISAAYDTSKSRKSTTSFVQYNLKAYYYKLSLASPTSLMQQLVPAAAKDFGGALSAKDLVAFYGTHYISSLIVGGRCSYCCTVDTTSYSSDVSLSVAAQVSFEGVVGSASASVTAAQKAAATQLRENSSAVARVLGGDPRLAARILNGDFTAWAESIPDNLEFADCAGGLQRISALVGDPARKQEIDAAIDDVLARHPLPDAPDMVPVTSFHTGSPSRWYFTTTPETRPAKFGPGDAVPFFVFDTPQPGTIPIWRLTAGNPTRFMLSPNRASRNGWSGAEVAFHAYPGPAADGSRVRVNAFTCDASPATSGWYYTTGSSVKGWSRDDSNTFYAPRA
ncbi:MAG: MAC/perforin domain-containing protein [Vicinamibacterales bacterium]